MIQVPVSVYYHYPVSQKNLHIRSASVGSELAYLLKRKLDGNSFDCNARVAQDLHITVLPEEPGIGDCGLSRKRLPSMWACTMRSARGSDPARQGESFQEPGCLSPTLGYRSGFSGFWSLGFPPVISWCLGPSNLRRETHHGLLKIITVRITAEQ